MTFNASGLNQKQFDELKKALMEKKLSLTREIDELEKELQEEADSGKDNTADEVDRSSFEEEMQRQQSVLLGKQHLLDEIEAAFFRIENGSYGVCVETEEPIGYQRLKAQPWVKYSLEAQKEIEARKKRPHGSGAGGGSDSGYPPAFE